MSPLKVYLPEEDTDEEIKIPELSISSTGEDSDIKLPIFDMPTSSSSSVSSASSASST